MRLYRQAWILLLGLLASCGTIRQDNTQEVLQEETETFMENLQTAQLEEAEQELSDDFEDSAGFFTISGSLDAWLKDSGIEEYAPDKAEEFRDYYLSRIILAWSVQDIEQDQNQARVRVEVRGIDDAALRSQTTMEKLADQVAEEEGTEQEKAEKLLDLLKEEVAGAQTVSMNYYITFEKTDDGWEIIQLQITI